MADYVASSTYTSEQAAQDTLISNTLASVSVNAGNISTETTRATAAEGVNAAAIAAETTRATAAEGANVTALAGKVDDGQVLTNVPASAVFTDTNTTYSVGDGGLTEKNFTSADNTKLDGIAASANNYSHPGTHDASMLTGTLPAISGANLTNLPAGGHTISIGQGTSTWYHNYPCGVRRTTVTLNARSFFPRIEENSYGTRVHEDHPHVQGVRTGGGSSIPGGVGSNYTVPLTIFQDFMCDHGRGAGGRISWEYLTYS
jgi:hypothetical protein